MGQVIGQWVMSWNNKKVSGQVTGQWVKSWGDKKGEYIYMCQQELFKALADSSLAKGRLDYKKKVNSFRWRCRRRKGKKSKRLLTRCVEDNLLLDTNLRLCWTVQDQWWHVLNESQYVFHLHFCFCIILPEEMGDGTCRITARIHYSMCGPH